MSFLFSPIYHSRYSSPCMATLYILLGLLLLPCSSSANDTLTAGQALAVGDKLVSSNGKFALGFFQPAASTITSKFTNITSTANWYLGIWFNQIPVFTTVWVANRDQPIPNDPKLNLTTHLKISSNGNLIIVHDEVVIWSTHITPNSRIRPSINTTSVVLMNSANLVLTSLSDQVLWESFDYPTDVVLPGAKFGWNKVTRLNRRGISKKSTVDPGLGYYSIELQTNGNGIMLKRRKPSLVYRTYLSETSSILKLLPRVKKILELVPQTKGVVIPYYFSNKEEEYYMYNSTNESASSFLSLDISGQIKLNIWSQAQGSWQVVLDDPIDVCTPPATCGPFTVCNGKAQPSCGCMESFSKKSPRHWEFGDRSHGCVRDSPLYCTSNKNTTSSTDMFQPISQVTLPYNPQRTDLAASRRNCEESCLSSCSCTAYSYNNNSICSVWHGKLLGVNLNDDIEISSEDTLYLRLAAKDEPILQKDKRKPNVGVVMAASISSFVLLMLMFLLVIWRNKLRWCGSPLYCNQGTTGIIAFRYTDLSHATKNFSEKLGTGGFGSVYKGVLSDLTTIAVKRLDGARQGEKQFRAEVSSIGLIHHVNLVKLIGFCSQGDNRLLVYEHMSNGSLDGHLFKNNVVLNWDTRYQIVLGVARGLSYLHQSCHECIIHCDIKPENILVDASFFPKIADFGMAAFVGRNFSRVLTTFRGTVGYLAPEWLSGVAVTPKVDVYSFGMVLFEIISGKRNFPEAHSDNNDHVEYFPMLVVSKLYEGDMHSLVDPRLHEDFNEEQAKRICKVALWCIQDNELDRPSMGEVVRVLEGLQEIDMLPMPRLLAAITKHSNSS
ncbi:G-type lectin S-receptor-like serine/threonine-protein kinase At2g19130 [Lolium perenne]|uniref:G-type lectin S-receptor-like serine/threonine-protein kinase At2g19130 n=1 Tax=Lolium perenne TaxID=4522 RepID=UPI003A98D24F